MPLNAVKSVAGAAGDATSDATEEGDGVAKASAVAEVAEE